MRLAILECAAKHLRTTNWVRSSRGQLEKFKDRFSGDGVPFRAVLGVDRWGLCVVGAAYAAFVVGLVLPFAHVNAYSQGDPMTGFSLLLLAATWTAAFLVMAVVEGLPPPNGVADLAFSTALPVLTISAALVFLTPALVWFQRGLVVLAVACALGLVSLGSAYALLAWVRVLQAQWVFDLGFYWTLACVTVLGVWAIRSYRVHGAHLS